MVGGNSHGTSDRKMLFSQTTEARHGSLVSQGDWRGQGGRPAPANPLGRLQLQKKVEPLMKAIQSGGNPSEIAPKIHELRREHAIRLEALLNETQRVQWKKMIGKPFELDE